MKSVMGIVQTSLRFLARGSLVLPLLIFSGASRAQQAVQSPNPEEKKQEVQKDAKKAVPRVWTNDDFPSGRALPSSTPKPQENQPKPETAPPSDPTTEKYTKMSPNDRQDLIVSDESDIQDMQKSIDELRDNIYKESDDKRESTMQEIARLEKGLSDTRHELEILRKLPPPEPQKKDSQPPASPPTSSSETGANSASPPK